MTRLKCAICSREIEARPGGWSHGNNAWPAADGRCCEWCNWNVVLPLRIKRANDALREN